MAEAVELFVRYRPWIFAGAAVLAVVYLRRLWLARADMDRTPFGLEKDFARQRQNAALGMLLVLAGVVAGTQLMVSSVAPQLEQAAQARASAVAPTPMPTPTPIVESSGPLVIDTSGCQNPGASLTEPQPEARISGSYEVRGTADIPAFAFYKFEISGPGTNGVWVPLFVGNEPVITGSLGSFDSSAYPPGAYAFRLVVVDSAGQFPLPCTVPVTFVGLQPAPPTP